jgi:MoaA/NifB/PqqE/SkfB family radical SAM enzyme
MSSVRQGPGELSTAQWLEFFDQVKRDFGSKVMIQITGGEALVRPDIFEILEHLKTLGFKTGIVTNGLLLNRENLPKLKELVVSLSISLDGFDESHNYLRGDAIFDRVLANIRLAKETGLGYLVLKTTVYQKNLGQLREFYEFIQKLGIDEWHLFAMEPVGRGRQNQDDILSVDEYLKLCEFIDSIKGGTGRKMRVTFEEQGAEPMYEKACEHCRFKLCQAGLSLCSVLYNGDVVNCIQDDRSKLEIHGNITREPLKKIWGEKFIKHREKGYTYCDNHYFLNKLSGKS